MDTLFPEKLTALAKEILDTCRTKKHKLVLAESCTGGLITACLTEIPGSSDVIERGLLVYSNQAKMDLLGVPVETLKVHGSVSEETAKAMAKGALERAPEATLALSVTGIAGPGGSTAEKSVGLVYIGLANRSKENVDVVHNQFHGTTRTEIRLAALAQSLILLKREVI